MDFADCRISKETKEIISAPKNKGTVGPKKGDTKFRPTQWMV